MRTKTIFGIGVFSLGMMFMPGPVGAQENRLQDVPSPAEALRNLETASKAMFMMADVNHDGQLSQKEAIDANNRLVGGFFFEADKDGNGVLSEGEAKAVQETYL